MSSDSHAGRIAVVTGAARGFGRVISEGLAQRGATVVCIDLNSPEETVAQIKSCGGTAIGVKADVSDPAQTADIGASLAEKLGRCDILINNAGIFPNAPIGAIDYAAWRKVLSVNLDAQFLMVKAVLPLMEAQGWGRIVNMATSVAGTSIQGFSHYIASKMGVMGLTRGLANDVAAMGITVNAVGPTITKTPGVIADVPDVVLDAVANAQSIKRVGMPEDILGAVLFLSGDESAFITGQTLLVDGGLNKT